MFVCLCKAVDDEKIRQAIAEGADTVDAVGAATGAGTGCGSCTDFISDMIASETRTNAPTDCSRRRLPIRLPLVNVEASEEAA